MFKKTIKYVDFNGTEREEDYYFHMSVQEVTRLEAKFGGKGIETYSMELAANQDAEAMISFIEDIVLSSYGKKTEDGKNFFKSPKIREEFEYSQAYAELFEELLSDADAAKKFATGIATQTKKMKAQKLEVINDEPEQ